MFIDEESCLQYIGKVYKNKMYIMIIHVGYTQTTKEDSGDAWQGVNNQCVCMMGSLVGWLVFAGGGAILLYF